MDKRFNFIFILILIGIFVSIKIPHLSLPYFWDEAWSYFPAIKKMAELGPSLFPGTIPLEVGKGHPQFFLFCSSLWMKISTGDIVFIRTLPLLISVGTILASYIGLKKNINSQAAFIVLILLPFQSLFLAQASLLLPEMLLTLFLVLSLFFFHTKRYRWYAFSATLMVQTKETALIFAFIFGIAFLLKLIKKENRQSFKWINLFFLILPGLIYALFLLLHYNKFGVVFYGDHLAHVNTEWSTVSLKISRALSITFVQYGRILLGISFIALLTYNLLVHKRIPHADLILLIGFLIIAFIFFSAFNFFTLRYMLAPMVLFILAFTIVASELQLRDNIKYPFIIILSAICLGYSILHKKSSDADLGYVEVVNLQKEMVHYCERANFYDKSCAVSFNMLFALKNMNLGYRTTQKSFTKTEDWKHYLHSRYFIYESTYGGSGEIKDYVENNFRLVKSFKNKHAWGYIYENDSVRQPDNE